MEIKTNSEIRKLSPADAKAFLDNHNFHLQRAVKPSHVSGLTAAMRDGEFPPGTAIYFAKTPSSLELLDGQHRLRAQMAAEMEIEYAVVTLECPDEKTAGVLYTQFDIGAKRTVNDRMKALDLAKHLPLQSKQAALFALGAPYIKYKFCKMTPFQVTQMTPVQRLEVCQEYSAGAVKFFECMANAEKWVSKVFLRPNFVALGAYLFQHAPEQAERLWAALATNDCGGPNDPRSHMMSLAQNAETKSLALRRSLVMSQAFIRGWNAMIEGRELTSKLSPAPLPAEHIKILGIGDEQEQPTSPPTKEEVTAAVIEQLAMRFPPA